MANITNSKVNGVSYTYDQESRSPLGLAAKMAMWEGALVYDKNTKAPTERIKTQAPLPAGSVTKPVITIDKDGKVTITARTAGATIFYTTDGSNPTTASTKYTAVFTVEDKVTVKAIAVATIDGEEKVSTVASKQYVKASQPSQPTDGKFTIYFGSIYNTDPDDDKLATFATYTDEEFLAKVTGTDPKWGGDVETVQASTLRNFVIQLPVASHSEDAYMWKFVAAPKAKVPAGFTIVEEQTKGEQTPIMTRDVTIDGVVYTAFYGFTDTDLKIILDYHA